MLQRMITRYCEKLGFKVNVLHIAFGSEAGIKSMELEVKGQYAYGHLKSEAGTHRLVRISPFDAEKMRHTSFAKIQVVPIIPAANDLVINEKDIKIDTFMASGHGGQSVNTTYSAVRITHLPTKITVSCQNERSQLRNKELALKVLKNKLLALKLKKEKEEQDKLKGENVSAEWGKQIRSYVLHPYQLVKDHRTNYSTKEINKVLDGDLLDFTMSFLKWNKK